LRRLLIVLAVLLAIPGAASIARAEMVEIVVNKISQKMTVKVDGTRAYVWPVSTGRRGYDTPTGTFQPYRMARVHFSKEWDDAPMPYSLFFTPGGHAIHGSPHVKYLGRAVSHGCVRLAPENAARLYALVAKAGLKNTRVVIRGGLLDGSLLAPDAPGTQRHGGFWLFRWTD
jgi:lipoprotein-anchoring transpeptidase ErfK/SrfK